MVVWMLYDTDLFFGQIRYSGILVFIMRLFPVSSSIWIIASFSLVHVGWAFAHVVLVRNKYAWHLIQITIFRSIHQRYPVKKTFLEILQNSQENILTRVSFLTKWLWHMCFPVNFAKFLRTPFLQNTSGRLLLDIFLLLNNILNCFIFTTFYYNSVAIALTSCLSDVVVRLPWQ